MNVCEDSLLSFRGRLFETVDVVPQQSSVHSDRTGKFRHIDFLVGEEEPLHCRRLCIFILKTLEADVLIQIPPVDSIKTKGVLLALLWRSLFEPGIPEQGLAVNLSFLITTKYLVAAEPYFCNLHNSPPFTG